MLEEQATKPFEQGTEIGVDAARILCSSLNNCFVGHACRSPTLGS